MNNLLVIDYQSSEIPKYFWNYTTVEFPNISENEKNWKISRSEKIVSYWKIDNSLINFGFQNFNLSKFSTSRNGQNKLKILQIFHVIVSYLTNVFQTWLLQRTPYLLILYLSIILITTHYILVIMNLNWALNVAYGTAFIVWLN